MTVYQYDPLGRNTAEIWYADATDADADQDRLATIAYTYDAAGRMLMATSPLPLGEGQGEGGATYEYVYDDLGRVIEETQTIDGLASEIALSYELSAMGLVEKVSVAIGGTADTVTDYEYDALGRVTKIEQHGAIGGNAVAEKRIDLTYDAQSRYATISYYSDLDGLSGNLVMTATYTYDPSGRLTDLVYTDSTTATIREFDWAYNAVGWITSHDSDIASEDVTSYAYDATGQLIGADYASVGDESYVYDSNGNRVLVDGTDSYTTGDNNQTTSDGTFTYLYDAEGNLQYRFIDGNSDGELSSAVYDTDVTEFVWDHRDRLTRVVEYEDYGDIGVSPESAVDYIYDCFNHRIASLYDDDGDGDVDVEERYVWQQNSPLPQAGEGQGVRAGLGKGNVVLDFIDTDGDGETYSLELANRYVWGQMVDQLFAQENVDDGGVEDVLYPVRDNLGSTRSLVNYLGQITATYSYDTFGNVSVLVGSISDTRYLFTCQEYDLTTGFYYYDARWYDPTVGKFISVDPIGYMTGVNLYKYVRNNPVLRADPSGLIEYTPEGNTENTKNRMQYGICHCDCGLKGEITTPLHNTDIAAGWGCQEACSLIAHYCEFTGYYELIQPPKPANKKCRWYWFKEDIGDDYDCCKRKCAQVGGGHWGIVSDCNGLEFNGENRSRTVPPSGWKPDKDITYIHIKQKTLGNLKWGNGAGRSCKDATDSEIRDCLRNVPPFEEPYIAGMNDCQTDTLKAARGCCLDIYNEEACIK